MDTSPQVLMEMYRRMVRIRSFELAAVDLFKRGLVKGTIHSYVGQEASAVGVCMALRDDDWVFGTHRNHGYNLAKGIDPSRMMAEILGREGGFCQGRGGSMHIMALEKGSLAGLPIVGAGLPLAVGAALAFKMRGEDRLAVAFVGDAGSNTGNWHESLNLAAIWNLPVLFVLENNRYGVSTRIEESCKLEDLSRRAAAYGLSGARVDGFDVQAVYRAASEAIARVRAGEGPSLLVTESYRFEGHYVGEPEVYRSKSEVMDFRRRDPIESTRIMLLQSGHVRAEGLQSVEREISAEISEAVRFAQNCPQPDPASAMDYVYAE